MEYKSCLTAKENFLFLCKRLNNAFKNYHQKRQPFNLTLEQYDLIGVREQLFLIL